MLALVVACLSLSAPAHAQDAEKPWYDGIKPLEEADQDADGDEYQTASADASAYENNEHLDEEEARILAARASGSTTSTMPYNKVASAQQPAPQGEEEGAPQVHEEEVEEEKHWYSWFWPLGQRTKIEALKSEYVPFRTEQGVTQSRKQVYNLEGAQRIETQQEGELLPGRPKLAVELGNGFLDTGNLSAGYEVPVIGAVWQPRFWAYLINRTTFQSFEDGRSGRQRETEIANRLDLFFNLQLTGTEKILLGIRPTDRNRPGQFTRYTFDGASEGFNDNFAISLETLFFEGDLGSLFPVLDEKGIIPLDLGFTVGRQPLVFQEGILINDTIDAVGLIRNNIPLPGTSNFRASAIWGWNRIDRNDLGRETNDNNLFGLFLAADTSLSTYNFDFIYVNDQANGDGLYGGFAAIQRLPYFDNVSTAFRINTSLALEDEIPGNVVGDGILLTSEISKRVTGSEDIVYFNSFLGLGNYTQAGREAVSGGPLANTGILFASPNLSTYLAELDPFITDSVVGGAVGYQAFWDDKRRNLILEVAGRHDLSGDGFDSLGLGFQLQQAVGQHVQLQFEGFYAFNEGRDDGAGGRAEVQVVY